MRQPVSSSNNRLVGKDEIRFREDLGDLACASLPREQYAVSLWLRLMKTYNLILREARKTLDRGLTLPQFDVIAQLHREADGLTQTELTRRLLVTSANLTGIISRLEAQGLVQRKQHDRDRRAVRLRLTKKGERFAETAIPHHAVALTELLQIVPFEDQRKLRSLLGRVNHRLEHWFQVRRSMMTGRATQKPP